ncbi:sigma-70 family RNA polymerase sigma factor [Cohnella laeviribosi]|uniref:sigma-70 family RNA polymerase sigma factor n=1 Tax=Cohnella laeviribosi TaxID=380174 RepID=UPI003D1E07D0
MEKEAKRCGQTIDLGKATADNYRKTRRGLLLAADRLTREIAALEPVRSAGQMDRWLELERQRKLVLEMIDSCSYVIEWLETGRRPGNRRGIERRSGVQREILTDPSRLPAVAPVCRQEEVADEGGEERRRRIEAALRGLTERERECYVLAHAQCYSYAEIAALLGISKSSVSTYVLRAQRKIAANVGGSVFLVG